MWRFPLSKWKYVKVHGLLKFTLRILVFFLGKPTIRTSLNLHLLNSSKLTRCLRKALKNFQYIIFIYCSAKKHEKNNASTSNIHIQVKNILRFWNLKFCFFRCQILTFYITWKSLKLHKNWPFPRKVRSSFKIGKCHKTKLGSSRPEVFLWKGVLKTCSKLTGEHSSRSAILIKLLCQFIEITLRHGCSLVNLLHIFRTPFPKKPLDGCFWKLNLPVIFNWKVLGKYGSFFVCNLLFLITVT